jgi:transcriptional regulator GlxA family with amidase domain
LIEEDFWPQVALMVARELVVYMKRPRGQEHFSAPPKFKLPLRAALRIWRHGCSDGSIKTF